MYRSRDMNRAVVSPCIISFVTNMIVTLITVTGILLQLTTPQWLVSVLG